MLRTKIYSREGNIFWESQGCNFKVVFLESFQEEIKSGRKEKISHVIVKKKKKKFLAERKASLNSLKQENAWCEEMVNMDKRGELRRKIMNNKMNKIMVAPD